MMSWELKERARRRLASEQGTIYKDWGGKIPIALAYPNSYFLGMSNLGFQAVYGLLNAYPNVVCERVFYEGRLAAEADAGEWTGPERPRRGREPGYLSQPILLESQRPVTDAAVLAFSISYELDYFNVPALLRDAGIPVFAADRDERHPIVMAGGPAVMANPEPLAPFFDVMVNGEAEAVLPAIVPVLEEGLGGPREELLRALGQIPGVYVPASPSGPVERQAAADVNAFPTTSVVLTDYTELGDLYLIEVSRGCGRGCRFCLAGYIFRPVRIRKLDLLLEQARIGLQSKRRIGLIGPAATDYPWLDELVTGIRRLGGGVALSSIRMERLSPTLVQALVESGTKTITLAPETGNERLRRDVAKRMPDEKIFRAVDLVAQHGIRRLKLYFMIGLPTETDEDARDIVRLVLEIKRRLDAVHPGSQIVVTISPFVPKADTPFQWLAMAPVDVIEHRIGLVERGLRARGIAVRYDSVEWAAVQAVLARGDRRISQVLARVDRLSLSAWNRACEQVGVDPAEYIYRDRPIDAPLPWEVMANGLKPGLLERELGRTLERAAQDLAGPVEPLLMPTG